jgi:hypothetical protein
VFGRAFQGLQSACAWLLFGAFQLATARVGAQEEPSAAPEEAVRIQYSVPGVCPDQTVFLDRVRARTQQGRFVEAAELARAFDVTISDGMAKGGFIGHLEFVSADGQRSVRNVAGATCDEVASSLALITALAIDDRIAQAGSAEKPPLPSPPRLALREPPKEAKPSLPVSPSAAKSVPHSARVPLRWDLGGNAAVSSWLAPSPAFAFGGFVELGSHNPSWSVRLSGFDARGTKTDDVGTASFATDWLRLDACPVALALRGHFSLSPCAALDGGQLRAAGTVSGVAGSTRKNDAWVSTAALLRLGWVWGDRLVLGLDGELAKPLVGYSFEFKTAQLEPRPLFSVPTFGVGAKVGVGVRFP